jgi:signal transduction histidine kinase
LLSYLDEFKLDSRNIPELSETRIREFRLLNSSVQKLLEANVDSYSKQKQFIENASHELQTPLAIAINKLELLAGESKLSGDQVSKIGEIIDALRRLSGLNKSLLLFSKIENKQFTAQERVHFDDLFSRILRDFKDFTEYKELNIAYSKDSPWSYSMNADLAEMLVMNLVKNAIVHNYQGGDIHICLQSSGFVIENTSTEPPLLPEQLFLRFRKKSENKQSTGLGLAIVKAIAEESGLEIAYSYEGRHMFAVKAR